MKRSVVIKRLGYETSAGWTTYGTSPAAFSSFQGVATPHENSLVDLQFFSDFLHAGDHIIQLLSRGPARSLAQSAIRRKR